MRSLIALSLLLSCPAALRSVPVALPQDKQSAVTLAVQDGAGLPLKDVLLILQDLENRENEIVRALTNENGEITPFKLRPGLYRAIATAPYGLWETQVREFLVREEPIRLVLKVEPRPTHGNGDITTIGTQKLSLRVLQPDGRSAANALVLVRDKDATLHLERWYRSDDSGRVTVEAIGNPVVVVVVFGKMLFTHEISPGMAQETIRLPEL